MKKLLFTVFVLFFILSSFIFSQFKELPKTESFEKIAENNEAKIFFEYVSSDNSTFVIQAIIPKGYYAYINSPYAKKITFIEKGKTIETVYPQGVKKGEDTIIKGEAYFTLLYKAQKSGNIEVSYQLCSEKDNICLPPQTETVYFKIQEYAASENESSNAILSNSANIEQNNSLIDNAKEENIPSNATSLDSAKPKKDIASRITGEKNIFIVIIIIFIAGLLSSFLPCMYPLIPVTASIMSGRSFGGEKNEKPNIKNIVFSSLLFCFGIIITYTLLGSIVSLAGHFFGGIIQFGSLGYNPFVLSFLVLLFLFFTFSMAGFYELSFFGFLQNAKSSAISKKSLWQKFIAGCLTALVASPCAAPVVATILELAILYPQRGIIYMASYASGFSLFLFVVGVSSAFITTLPKPGAWMNIIRYIFTAVMVGVCLYYGNILFEVLGVGRYSLFIASLIILFFGAFIYLIKRKNIALDKKSIITVFVIIFIFNIFALTYDSIKSYEEKTITYEEAVILSKKEGKALFIDFSAVWCENCRLLKKNVLSNKELREYIDKNYIFVEVDIDENKSVAKEYGVRWLPWIVITDKNMEEIYKMNKFESFDDDMAKKILENIKSLN